MNQRLIICIIIILLTLFTIYICLFKTKPVDNLKKINQLPTKNFFDKTEIITVKNPIDGKNMLWVDNNFTQNNWPGVDFQSEQKKSSLKYVLKSGKGVLDIGAHIGDYGIPMAICLKNMGRSDIHVYCIDPSEDKCKFMEEICKLNNLTENITIICQGISNREGYFSVKEYGHGHKNQINTGSWQWTPDKNGKFFTTLDKLYENNIIGDIGFFWLDAQWSEKEILEGGIHYLKKNKPYILMEYDPPTSFEEDGITIRDYIAGSVKDLKYDKKFRDILNLLNIKILGKLNGFDDILLKVR